MLLNRLPATHPTPSLPSDSSGRNKVWNFTSSGFILSHSFACLCDATTGACDEDRRAFWLRSVFQHDSYLQQHVCVRWFHHLCLVRSCRRVDCVEATRFLSATGVGLLISVAVRLLARGLLALSWRPTCQHIAATRQSTFVSPSMPCFGRL